MSGSRAISRFLLQAKADEIAARMSNKGLLQKLNPPKESNPTESFTGPSCEVEEEVDEFAI